ncbi:MAG: (2Fe-2S)-binding protein [Hydrogenophilales bacterium 28-61-23]|nr:MAG: (2Fe-2S)-binding protein [Hydrogenophilales bacterium 28-61-23]
MVAPERLICASSALIEAGPGVRFEVGEKGRSTPAPAFVIRWRGQVYGYINRCGHISVELDWRQGEFFDFSQQYLICSAHGALYDPASGACQYGRCEGRGLRPVAVVERQGNVYFEES